MYLRLGGSHTPTSELKNSELVVIYVLKPRKDYLIIWNYNHCWRGLTSWIGYSAYFQLVLREAKARFHRVKRHI